MPIETPQGISSRVPPRNLARAQIFLLGFGVPERGLERGFGHVVPANGREQVPHFRSGGDFFSFQKRPKIIAQNQPGGFHRFVGIEGIFAGG